VLETGAGELLGHLQELELTGGSQDYGEGVWRQGARGGLTCSMDDLRSRRTDRKVRANYDVVGERFWVSNAS